jgi:hypothetical protein
MSSPYAFVVRLEAKPERAGQAHPPVIREGLWANGTAGGCEEKKRLPPSASLARGGRLIGTRRPAPGRVPAA